MKFSKLAQALMITGAMALMSAGCSQNSGTGPATEIEGTVAGTFYKVTVPGEFPGGEEALRKLCEQTFTQIMARLNDMDPQSEISLFNASKDRKAHAVSEFLGALIEECKRQGERVDNTMDISVAPLIELWKGNTAPSQAAINRARKLIGPQNYVVRKVAARNGLTTTSLPDVPAPGDAAGESAYTNALSAILFQSLNDSSTANLPYSYTVTKRKSGVMLDMATVGEGLAVDMVANALDKLGLNNYLVAIAGASRTRGVDASGKTWQIGIEDPTVKDNKTYVPVCPLGKALSTAGSYRSYFVDEGDGKFYSNVFDPRTGRPVGHRTVSVSVIADTALTTDALDTGLMVMGADRALEFAEREHVPVYIIELDADGKPVARFSKNFQPYLDCKTPAAQ